MHTTSKMVESKKHGIMPFSVDIQIADIWDDAIDGNSVAKGIGITTAEKMVMVKFETNQLDKHRNKAILAKEKIEEEKTERKLALLHKVKDANLSEEDNQIVLDKLNLSQDEFDLLTS